MNVTVCGLDENGKKATKIFTLDKLMKISVYEALANQYTKNDLKPENEAVKQEATNACTYCLNHSESEAHFVKMMEECGYIAVIKRMEKYPWAPYSITIADTESKDVYFVAGLGESCALEKFRDIDSEKWEESTSELKAQLEQTRLLTDADVRNIRRNGRKMPVLKMSI